MTTGKQNKANLERANCRAFLRRCFSPEEWELIIQRQEFLETLRSVRTFDDAERAIRSGLKIVSASFVGEDFAQAA